MLVERKVARAFDADGARHAIAPTHTVIPPLPQHHARVLQRRRAIAMRQQRQHSRDFVILMLSGMSGRMCSKSTLTFITLSFVT